MGLYAKQHRGEKVIIFTGLHTPVGYAGILLPILYGAFGKWEIQFSLQISVKILQFAQLPHQLRFYDTQERFLLPLIQRGQVLSGDMRPVPAKELYDARFMLLLKFAGKLHFL